MWSQPSDPAFNARFIPQPKHAETRFVGSWVCPCLTCAVPLAWEWCLEAWVCPPAYNPLKPYSKVGMTHLTFTYADSLLERSQNCFGLCWVIGVGCVPEEHDVSSEFHDEPMKNLAFFVCFFLAMNGSLGSGDSTKGHLCLCGDGCSSTTKCWSYCLNKHCERSPLPCFRQISIWATFGFQVDGTTLMYCCISTTTIKMLKFLSLYIYMPHCVVHIYFSNGYSNHKPSSVTRASPCFRFMDL